MAGASISQSIQPTQRGAILYSSGTTVSTDFRNRSSLVVLGRVVTNPGRAEAANAGAIVLVYLNITTFINSGTYHNFMFGTDSGGSALAAYPSGGTSFGSPTNIIGPSESAVLSKYENTIRKMKQDMPWMTGIFADDCGPDWAGYDGLSSSVREQFYLRQVALGIRARSVADELGLFLMSNGEWRADENHGYPVRNQWGCSLYDSFCIEHHAASQLPFWTTVGNGQWRLRDPNGQRCMFFIADNDSEVAGYRNQVNQAWMTRQTTPQYTSSFTPLTQLVPHDLGLSFGSVAPTITVTVTPTSASLLTAATQQFTGTASNSATLTWTVNGVAGGNATVGTITSGGLYTAPATVPVGGVVSVNASISTGQNASASVTITTTTPPDPEAVLPAAPAPSPSAFGNRFSAINPNNMTPNYVRGCTISAPEDGTIQSLTVGIDGGGPGTADQPFTLRLFASDSSGNGAALEESSTEHTTSDGDPPAWLTLDLVSPLAVTAGETLYACIHSGGTEATARFFRNVNPGVSRGTSDTYADGSIASLASTAVGDADISIYANYTKAAVAGVAISAHHVATSVHGMRISGGGVTVPVEYIAVKTRRVSRTVPEPYFIDSRDESEVTEISPGVFRPI